MNPPPLAEAVQVRVERGGRVEIPLGASGRLPGVIRFLVRTSPLHGSLGDVVQTSEKSAAVVYRHDGRRGVSGDEFRFAAQAVDSPVSAAATVRILIEEPPVRPVVTREIDFGDVAIGAEERREVVISNSRGGDGVVVVSVDAPWSLPAGGKVVLQAGGRAAIPLVFRASRAGEFASLLRIANHPEATARLLATASATFAVNPSGSLVFGVGEPRTVAFTVKNLKNTPLAASIEYPQGVRGPLAIEIPPGGSREVTATLGGVPPAPGQIVITAGGAAETLGVEVPAVPPRLTAAPQALDFGEVRIGQKRVLKLSVRNDGGASGSLVFDPPPGILVVPDPNSLVLPPGASREFSVELHPTTTGIFQSKLVFNVPDSSCEVSVRARTSAMPPVLTTPPSTPLVISAPLEMSQPEPADGPPPPKNIEMVSSEPGQIVLRWDSPDAVSQIMECRQIVADDNDGIPRTLWNPWRTVSFAQRDGKTTATIFHLPPDSALSMRIVAIAPDGRRGAPSRVLRIVSPPRPTGSLVPMGVVLFACLALVAFLVRKFRHRAHRSKAEEARRISRLEG